MAQTIKDRILEFIAFKKISVHKFEMDSGLGNAYVTRMPKRITDNKLRGLRAAYPELNINWLLTGDGDMLLETPDDPATFTKRLDALNSMRMTIEAKDALIKAKDETIEILKQTVEVYRETISILESRLNLNSDG